MDEHEMRSYSVRTPFVLFSYSVRTRFHINPCVKWTFTNALRKMLVLWVRD